MMGGGASPLDIRRLPTYYVGMGMTKFTIRELLDIIRIGSPAGVDLDLAERVENVLAYLAEDQSPVLERQSLVRQIVRLLEGE